MALAINFLLARVLRSTLAEACVPSLLFLFDKMLAILKAVDAEDL
jgi:hypothetical protein